GPHYFGGVYSGNFLSHRRDGAGDTLTVGWALDEVLRKVENSASNNVSTGQWDFSRAEITSVMTRTRELLLGAGNDGGGQHESC
ncbi:hypothetical protein ABZO35_30340, partial [Burkholderia pseudomallei]